MIRRAARPSRRFRDLIFEYCAERVPDRAYRSALKTVSLEVYREKRPARRERAKVHPYVPLLEKALRREFEALLGVAARMRRTPARSSCSDGKKAKKRRGAGAAPIGPRTHHGAGPRGDLADRRIRPYERNAKEHPQEQID
jgi:hypothetical protein